MKKSFYTRTFQLNTYLVGLNLMLLLLQIPINLLETGLLSNKYTMFEPFAKETGDKIAIFSKVLQDVNVLLFLLLLAMVLPELIERIKDDSLKNWIYSTWVSFRLRGFLIRQSDYEGEGTFKLQRHNKAIWKTVIDIRKVKITLVVKLPNDAQAQKMILEAEDILREEVSNRFPDYMFSNFERHYHWLKIVGTKKR